MNVITISTQLFHIINVCTFKCLTKYTLDFKISYLILSVKQMYSCYIFIFTTQPVQTN